MALIAVPIAAVLGVIAFLVFKQPGQDNPARSGGVPAAAGTVGQALRLPTNDAPATASGTSAGGAPALQSAASRYPVGQWVRPFQKATDIHQKWFDAGVKWEQGWITPGADYNQSISLGAPNAQGRNWGARARIRCGGGFANIVLRRNGLALSNTMACYEFRVTKKGGAEFVHGQGRGSVSGSDRKPLGDPFPIPLTEGQEVLIEAFAIGDTLYGRVEGKVFSAKTDGMLKEGGFEVATQIMPCRDIEFINLDGLTEAEAKKAVGLE